MKTKLKEISRENLQKIILEMAGFLTEEQYQRLQGVVEAIAAEDIEAENPPVPSRMSQELVDEKMGQIKVWMEELDEGEVYLDTEEYEDYSGGYWDRDWITEYYDNQDIGYKISSIIRFAKDCVDDRRYEEANFLYEWLWDMCVYTDVEFDENVDLELLAEKEIIKTDMEQLALLTLYTVYQVVDADKRAEDIYRHFSLYSFRKIHIEDMFYVGRENLTGIEKFWEDWIALLKAKSGDMESRLLKEALLHTEGAKGIARMAEENCQIHPGLYVDAIDEYEKEHNYEEIEKIGERALERIDSSLVIRSKVALRTAYASSCLNHKENVMRFCWEAFWSESTEKYLLRLFGTQEMAEKYKVRVGEIFRDSIKGNPRGYADRNNSELSQNIMGDYRYCVLKFYTGDFAAAKEASKNPEGSLGWSGRFIRYGIRLFMLYLYDEPLPSIAISNLAGDIDYAGDSEPQHLLDFEREIIEESRELKISTFWNYFQRWKRHFPMSKEEKRAYVKWAEEIVYGRADAIVAGQHRGHYKESAVLLAAIAEIKESMGETGAKSEIFLQYKRKFPRHSSFQAEMKKYFSL